MSKWGASAYAANCEKLSKQQHQQQQRQQQQQQQQQQHPQGAASSWDNGPGCRAPVVPGESAGGKENAAGVLPWFVDRTPAMPPPHHPHPDDVPWFVDDMPPPNYPHPDDMPKRKYPKLDDERQGAICQSREVREGGWGGAAPGGASERRNATHTRTEKRKQKKAKQGGRGGEGMQGGRGVGGGQGMNDGGAGMQEGRVGGGGHAGGERWGGQGGRGGGGGHGGGTGSAGHKGDRSDYKRGVSFVSGGFEEEAWQESGEEGGQRAGGEDEEGEREAVARLESFNAGGFALKMLQKMGYKGGGLGKEGTGMKQAIEAKRRPTGCVPPNFYEAPDASLFVFNLPASAAAKPWGSYLTQYLH